MSSSSSAETATFLYVPLSMLFLLTLDVALVVFALLESSPIVYYTPPSVYILLS